MDEWDFTSEDEPLSPALEPDRSAWAQRLVGRLGGVRIHDTAQAGELASRLGARAFTIGRDVYMRPELLRPATARSMALLAHELYHVEEQMGGAPKLEMPLLRPAAGRVSSATQVTRGATRAGSNFAVQRALTTDAPAPASQSGSELAAEAVESAVVRHEAGETGGQRPAKEPPSTEELCDAVMRMVIQELVLDKERAAGSW